MSTPIAEPTAHQNLMTGLQHHLESLRRTVDGEILYKLITRGLRRHEGSNNGIGHAFVQFLYSLLERYATDAESHPGTRIKARFIQQRLAPYLTNNPTRAGTPTPAETKPEQRRSATDMDA